MAIQNSAEPAVSQRGQSDGTQRLHLLAAVIILFLTASFFLIQYDRDRMGEAGFQIWYQAKASGILNEGDQYRVALPFVAHFLKVHTRLEMRQSVPLMQAGSLGLGLAFLYGLLIASPIFKAGSNLRRLAYFGLLFAAAQLPVLWIFPWARPETLPTFAYLAAATLVILEPRIPLSVACVLTLLLGLAQGFNRTDAPLVLGLATIIASVTIPLYRSRKATALLGALSAGAGIAAQAYLHHRFPSTLPAQRATTLQLFYNFNPHYGYFFYRMPPFVIGLFPFFVTLFLLRRGRGWLDPTDRFILLVALIYLPIYMAFGIISEVRIYVPYLFLLALPMAKIWAGFVSESAAPAT